MAHYSQSLPTFPSDAIIMVILSNSHHGGGGSETTFSCVQHCLFVGRPRRIALCLATAE
jgi:hypothetical protein